MYLYSLVIVSAIDANDWNTGTVINNPHGIGTFEDMIEDFATMDIFNSSHTPFQIVLFIKNIDNGKSINFVAPFEDFYNKKDFPLLEYLTKEASLKILDLL